MIISFKPQNMTSDKPHPYFNVLNSIKLERKMSSCCPENSWGKLNNPDYKAKGIVEKIKETNIDTWLSFRIITVVRYVMSRKRTVIQL